MNIVLPDWATEALKQSPMLAVSLLVVYVAFRRVTKEHESHLKSKDAEIQRLVEEKNQLQDLILSKRLSTVPGPAETEQKKKRQKGGRNDADK